MTEDNMNGWTQATTEKGMPYYVNHTTKQTEWDHPKMQQIMQSIEGCNAIRYASYRTAAKMQILHRELNMQYVRLELIAGVFERHRLSATENSVTLDSSEVEDVLSDIYFAASKEANTNINVDLATKLGVNYILKVFDRKREGKVLVFAMKLALTLISANRLQDKYGYLYQQLADHNACLSRAALHTLLTNICKVIDTLGESLAYGSHAIQSSVDSCFIESQGGLGVSETQFATWLTHEPPLLAWMSTLNRMQAAEYVTHNIKCSTCKVTPVQGPRYSCLRCAGYHQCQACFLLGKISRKHKSKHPVREYCIKTSNREITKLIVELIRNKLRLCPTRAIPVNLEDASPLAEIDDEAGSTSVGSLRSTVRRKVLDDPQKELQSIITHLEEENKQLQSELLEICGTKAHRLQRHRLTIESQLQRLKLLKKYLFAQTTEMPSRIMNRMESTPMFRPVNSRVTPLPVEFELSPIVRQGTIENSRTLESKIATHIYSLDKLPNNGKISDVSENMRTDIHAQADGTYTSSRLSNVSEFTRIELSTWIGGGNRTGLGRFDSGFSQWLASGSSNNRDANDYSTKPVATSSSHSDSPTTLATVVSHSPNGILRENTPSSLQRPDKHSQHSSLQNIQGDLNDILDRLQNMVANDCLLEESFSADDNCELKRAATEMEDLLTGLIEGMESRKSKLTTVV
ncbi:dystrophin [Cephus cinctus]|uniref:Dystrophin n=1 Tax=Cephus cinctus TaxID=211228 RepID=A0AAJ7CHP5_CEPCN|nr:dystrophin [Cephus cinctus]